jgi:hypothetical protein
VNSSEGGRKLRAHGLTYVAQQSSTGCKLQRLADTSDEQDQVVAPEPAVLSSNLEIASDDVSAADGSTPADLGQQGEEGNTPECNPATGPPPSLSNCTAYAENAWWLPPPYVVNATCACLATPDSPSANCVRQFLQDRLAATPTLVKITAAAALAAAGGPAPNPEPIVDALYRTFVQNELTPRIYQDHVDAYRGCCCPFDPAPYPAWVGVTTVPIPVCDLVGLTIRYFGSCHGTPGSW